MAARPTMATVAEAAGVSVPTVSRVLAGKPDISDETRSRVSAAVRATGYVARQGHHQRRSGIIDMLLETAATPWATELIAGAEHAAFDFGYTLAVTVTRHPQFRIHDWVETPRSRRCDGVMLVLPQMARGEMSVFTKLTTPLVALDPNGAARPPIPAVGATNWSGGVSATRHLLDLGHRRIGFIGGPSTVQCSRERHEGYLAAHREFRVAPDPALSRYGNFLIGSGAEHGGALLDLPRPPTAIFAASDQQAAGVYQAAFVRGVRIPGELSVVGFDDTAISQLLAPPLTTVRQPLTEMATECVRLIAQEQAQRGSASGRRIELATSLVIRESTTHLVASGTTATARRSGR